MELLDVDVDGDLDAFVTNITSEPDKLWINDGNGNFSDAGQVFPADAESQSSERLAFSDFDGDGDPDVVVANRKGANPVWRSTTDPVTDVQATDILTDRVRVSWTSRSGKFDVYRSLESAFDVNAERIESRITETHFDDQLTEPNKEHFYWVTLAEQSPRLGSAGASGTRPGTRAFVQWQEFESDAGTTDVDLADLDGDGDDDAFVTNWGIESSLVMLNSDGEFASTGQVFGEEEFQIYSALGDIDGDGDVDAVTANLRGANTIWVNDGNASFSRGSSLGASSSIDVALADLDGDGDLDIVFANAQDDAGLGFYNTVWINETQLGGDPEFQDIGWRLGNSQNQAVSSKSVEVADMDNDGRLDLVFGNQFASNHIYFDIESAIHDSTVPAPFTYDEDTRTTQHLMTGDVDDDGDLDLFEVNSGAGNPFASDRVFRNDGGRDFVEIQEIGNDSGSFGQFSDIDNDGDLDAVVANYFGTSRVWVNDGTGMFIDSGNTFSAAGADNTEHVALGDFDSDGDLDLFWVNSDAGNAIWENTLSEFPTNLRASDRLEDRIHLSWSPVSDATSYGIFRSSSSNVASAELIASDVQVTTYRDFSADGNTNYYYWVRAVWGTQSSRPSAVETGFRRSSVFGSCGAVR